MVPCREELACVEEMLFLDLEVNRVQTALLFVLFAIFFPEITICIRNLRVRFLQITENQVRVENKQLTQNWKLSS